MAGRHQKVRSVGIDPEYLGFSPDGLASGDDLTLTVDELEVLRLVDLERLSQAEAAQRMGVARATIAAICERARAKTADALVNGRRLVIAATSPMHQLLAATPSLGRQRERAS